MQAPGPARQLASILALPGTVTLVVPGLLVWWTGLGAVVPAWARLALGGAGFALLLVGVVLVISTVALFVRVGKGTLAPWDPTRKLVVAGPFRYVRNPMISGVAFVLLGEVGLLASLPVLAWFALFSLANAIYIPLSEEPGLAARFGEDYLAYRKNVPRWVPRLSPWTPNEAE